MRPVAFRPCLAAGLAFSIDAVKFKVIFLQLSCHELLAGWQGYGQIGKLFFDASGNAEFRIQDDDDYVTGISIW